MPAVILPLADGVKPPVQCVFCEERLRSGACSCSGALVLDLRGVFAACGQEADSSCALDAARIDTADGQSDPVAWIGPQLCI